MYLICMHCVKNHMLLLHYVSRCYTKITVIMHVCAAAAVVVALPADVCVSSVQCVSSG